MRAASRVPISYLLPHWLRSPLLPLVTGNELRAILPAWAVAFLAVLFSSLLPEGLRQVAPFFACGFGCVAIGSIAAGHDFAHRTLATTLSQPFSRERLWSIRFNLSLIAIASLIVLAGIQMSLWRVLIGPVIRGEIPFVLVLFAVPVLFGLFIAPWLTLTFRSSLAGTVFSTGLPFVLWFSSNWLVLFFGGTSNHHLILFLFLILGLSVLGAVVGRRQFLRLEAIEPKGVGFRLPSLFGQREVTLPTASAMRRGSPWIKLVAKELRLQSLAWLPALGMVVTEFSIREINSNTAEALFLVTALCGAATCVLIGGVGSAEERQLGTAEWGGLLPMARSQQWMVKAGVLVFLALLLAVFLPLKVLSLREWPPNALQPEATSWALAAIMLVSTSLYISSFCRTSMNAVLLSLPCAAVVVIAMTAFAITYRNFWEGLNPDLFWAATPFLLGAAIVGMLHYFACQNHFSIDRSRLWRQFRWLACALLFTAVVYPIFVIRVTIR